MIFNSYYLYLINSEAKNQNESKGQPKVLQTGNLEKVQNLEEVQNLVKLQHNLTKNSAKPWIYFLGIMFHCQ